MTNRKVFEIWSHGDSLWSGWVRPVQFVSIDTTADTSYIDRLENEFPYMKNISEDTAIILDAAGYNGVVEAIMLADLGFRPIPVYNATKAPINAKALLDTSQIEEALLWGANELADIKICKNAPPVFLLDSNRTEHFKMDTSIFDNSWDIYPQDLPSAEYFLGHEIRKILVKSEKIQADLYKIIYTYQQKGLEIFFTNGFDAIEQVVLKKLPKNKS